jgi:hypothetical protein
VRRRMDSLLSSYYLSPFFLSLLLTASLPPSSQSSSLLLPPHSSPSTSSLPIALLPLSHPHYLSPSFFGRRERGSKKRRGRRDISREEEGER